MPATEIKTRDKCNEVKGSGLSGENELLHSFICAESAKGMHLLKMDVNDYFFLVLL